MTFNRTCPVCNRNFQSLRPNATYCNIRCRQKAERERAAEKASAFYVPDAERSSTWELGTAMRPTLAEVKEFEKLLRLANVTLKKTVGMLIYGEFPSEWRSEGLPEVTVQMKEQGAGRYWELLCWFDKSKLQSDERALPLVRLGKIDHEAEKLTGLAILADEEAAAEAAEREFDQQLKHQTNDSTTSSP